MGYEQASLDRGMLAARLRLEQQLYAVKQSIMAAIKRQIQQVLSCRSGGGLAIVVLRHDVSRQVGFEVDRADIAAALAEMAAEGFVEARTLRRSELWYWRDHHNCILAGRLDVAYVSESGEQVKCCRWCGQGWAFDSRRNQPPRPVNLDWLTGMRGTTELEQRP